ncbi:MAG: hypothetical protein R8L07_15440 [Alphaproteobacteria bacterium]|nr:hypothetical protein [Alphaproteobacteria bacterium]
MAVDERDLLFSGSLLNGLTDPDGKDVDIIHWCGVQNLSEEQKERFHEEFSALNVLERCAQADIITDFEVDGFATGSDRYVKVMATDWQALKDELRNEIAEIIRNEL